MNQRWAIFSFFLCSLTLPLQAADWPGWRGADGLGVSTEANLPLRWSESENVAWKVEVPGWGIVTPADYNALVKEGRGRRVFPAAPEQSLLFRKATGLMPHGGGRRTEPDSPDGRLLLNWIEQGTPWGAAEPKPSRPRSLAS